MTSNDLSLGDSLAELEPRTKGEIALVLAALAMGGFAIGIAEFATMSILPDFAARVLAWTSRPRVTPSAPMPPAS